MLGLNAAKAKAAREQERLARTAASSQEQEVAVPKEKKAESKPTKKPTQAARRSAKGQRAKEAALSPRKRSSDVAAAALNSMKPDPIYAIVAVNTKEAEFLGWIDGLEDSAFTQEASAARMRARECFSWIRSHYRTIMNATDA